MLLSRALLVLCSLFGLVNRAPISTESMRLTVILVFKWEKELVLHRNTLEMHVVFEYLIYNFGIICNTLGVIDHIYFALFSIREVRMTYSEYPKEFQCFAQFS